MEAKQFVTNSFRTETRHTLLLGLMAGLLLTTFLFTWASGHKSTVLYAVGITLLGLIYPVMGGYHVWLGLPFQKFLTHHAVILMSNIGIALLLVHGIFFLNLHRTRARRGFLIYLGLVALLTATELILPYQKGITPTLLIIMATCALMAGLAVSGIIQKQRDARFYLAGNIFLWAYLWIQMFFYYGAVTYPVLPENVGVFCTSASLIFYLVSMALWIKVMRREKEAAQKQAISLQSKLNEELEIMVTRRTEELEQANRAKTELFSKVSHDLRAPISWLIGLSESMWLESRELKLSEEFKAYLGRIKKGSYYLMQLINNIMDAGALESGYQRLRIEPVGTLMMYGRSVLHLTVAIHRCNGPRRPRHNSYQILFRPTEAISM